MLFEVCWNIELVISWMCLAPWRWARITQLSSIVAELQIRSCQTRLLVSGLASLGSFELCLSLFALYSFDRRVFFASSAFHLYLKESSSSYFFVLSMQFWCLR